MYSMARVGRHERSVDVLVIAGLLYVCRDRERGIIPLSNVEFGCGGKRHATLRAQQKQTVLCRGAPPCQVTPYERGLLEARV
jgi:hypothetical protein